jgi:Ni/Co efflux regulator RcnB
MKKLLITSLVAVALAAPMAVGSASAQSYGQEGQRDHRDNDQRGDQSRNHGDSNDNGRHRDRRHSWRETDRSARWDDGRHNGYYRNSVWHRGPPPQSYMGRRNVRLGYRPWARGQRLGYYSSRYQQVDYRNEHLRYPPRGYHWVRDDSGDFLLAAIVGGLIAEVILSGSR